MNARQPGIWLRVLVVVPLMEVLPLLFLGRAYLESDTQNFFCTPIWFGRFLLPS